MSRIIIHDIDFTIEKSIEFLSNALDKNDNELSYDRIFKFLERSLKDLQRTDSESRKKIIHDILDLRNTIQGKSDFKKISSSLLFSRIQDVINTKNDFKTKNGRKLSIALYKAIDALLHYLINYKCVTPEEHFLPNTNFLEDGFLQSGCWRVFPEFQKFWLFLRSPKTVNDFADIIPKEWLSLYKKHVGDLAYTNAGNVVNCWRKVALVTNASNFKEITLDSFKRYRSLYTYDSILPWGTFVGAINALGSDINIDQLSGIGTRSLLGNHRTTGILAITTLSDDPLAYRISSTDFVQESATHVGWTIGFEAKNHVITLKRESARTYEIDNWHISQDDFNHYSLSKLASANPKNAWLKSQVEFINHYQESGSRKNAKWALRDLNIYIFSYLKSYFSSHTDLPYSYPESPSDFKPSIYVATSEIVTTSLYGNDVEFPVSFYDFFILLNGEKKSQTQQARYKLIIRYFDFCMASYTGIKGYEVLVNPLKNLPSIQIKSQSYIGRSVKKVLELEYWVLFCEYLYKIADTIVYNMERNESNANYKGAIEIPLGGMIKALDMSVHLESTIPMPLHRILYNGHYYCEPQTLLGLCVMASSGLRASNVFWLDLNDWDISKNADPKNEYSEIWVSTDKSREKPFKSLVKTDTYKLLKRYQRIRSKITTATKQSINYMGSEKSKWGEVTPLLGYGETNSVYEVRISEYLPWLLADFESQLRRNNLYLGSYTFYAPSRLDTNTIREFVKANKAFDIDPYKSALHLPGEHGVFFTEVGIFSEVTPHSLRKTLDTYLVVILGSKFVGELMTGQTQATVDYYTEVTPERHAKVISLADQIAPSLPRAININEVRHDSEVVKKRFSEQGINGLGGFQLSIKETHDDNNLPIVNPNDIAINNTHICIYGNDCPSEILKVLGKKDCALCPIAVSTASDLIGISAQIRFHADNITDFTDKISSPNISDSERQRLNKARFEEIIKISGWHARYEFIRTTVTDSKGFISLDDGADRIKKTIRALKSLSEGQALYARLEQVKSVPSLQSEKLRRTASRLSRKILKSIKADEYEVPDSNPVEVSLALISKVANAHGIEPNKIHFLLEDTAKFCSTKLSKELIEFLSDGA